MFVCGKCGKNCCCSHSLRLHQCLFEEQKLYRCVFCGETFTRSSVARKHLKLHSEKPYDCEFCDKQFRLSCHLTLHLRKHFRMKRHWCAVCGRGFERPCHLRAHKCKSKTEVVEQKPEANQVMSEHLYCRKAEAVVLPIQDAKPPEE